MSKKYRLSTGNNIKALILDLQTIDSRTCPRFTPSFKLVYYLAAIALILASCHPKNSDTGWQELFNGKDLSGWDTYLGHRIGDSVSSMHKEPIGLNNDPDRVFSVVNENREQVIRISGQDWGALTSQETFSNYHLQLQFKWGRKKWPPKEKDKRDSGLLYHAVGEQGADYGFWMRSQEFQIQEGDVGDYWGCAGAVMDIPARQVDSSSYIWDPSADLLTFQNGTPVGRHCIKRADAENSIGAWNTIDLYCHGDTAVHMVNHVVNMVLYHSRQDDDGTFTPLTGGKIQLQSEGAEVYFRNVRIQPIERIPAEVLE